MDRRLESRIEAIERRLNEMAGIELCDACGGPVPYTARGLSERLHADGEFERLYPHCTSCDQPVDADGRGTGRPSPIGRSVVETLLFDDRAEGKTLAVAGVEA